MAIASFDLFGGQIVGGGADFITVQPTVDVPATDPTDPAAGAVVAMICVQYTNADATVIAGGMLDDSSGTVCGVADYSNPYINGGPLSIGGGLCAVQTYLAVIGVPLTADVSDITVGFTEVADFVAITGRYYTGVQIDTATGVPTDATILDFASVGAGGPRGIAALLDESNPSVSLSWNYDGGGGAVEVVSPLGATDSTWEWILGDLAIYMVAGATASPNGAWTWASPDISTVYEFDDVDTTVGGFASIVYAEQAISPPINESLAGSFSGGSDALSGGGLGWVAGVGPTCAVTPPPGGGMPILHTQIRLSE